MSRPLRPSRRVLAASAAALTLVLTAGTGAGLAAASDEPNATPAAADAPLRPSLLDPATPEPPEDGDDPDEEPEEPEDSEEPDDDAEPTGEPADEPEPAAQSAAQPAAMPAITVEGDQILRGGQPWWFLGYNSFVWSGDCGHDDEKMSEQRVEDWFAGMRHDGHGAVRLFFYDGWDIDRLDHALATAKRHNIYLTITLDDAIGGCGENDKTAAWFADQNERDVYQAHMEMLLQRYRGETTFAWFEYFNEPDDENGALRAFFDEMGAAADRIDPDRLFSSGTVAPYWVDGPDNFLDIHQSPGVDIASLHEYDENETESNHGPGVRAHSAGKPVIVGEFGIKACEDDFDSRAERFARKAEVYTDTSIGYVGAFGWAWQPGRNGYELGNLDADEATQRVLREYELDEDPGPVTTAPTTTVPTAAPTTTPVPTTTAPAPTTTTAPAPTTTTPAPTTTPATTTPATTTPVVVPTPPPVPGPGSGADRAAEVRRAAQLAAARAVAAALSTTADALEALLGLLAPEPPAPGG